MKKAQSILLFLVVFGLAAFSTFAQQGNIVRTNLSQAEIDRIVRNFTAKEAEFRGALKNYVFNRNASIATVGLGGQITGEYRRDSFMTFSESGDRFEKILFAPVSTLREINVTPEDLEDLGGVNPFALEPSVASQYNFNFVGKERIDELDLYVFDVAPKVMPDPRRTKQRYFIGRIWVDDRDLQIVKSRGKAVPETRDNKFPIVETWRENVEGKYWFPSFSKADDELVFDNGNVVKIRMRVRYADYREGKTEVRILDDDTDTTDETEQPKPSPSPTPKRPN